MNRTRPQLLSDGWPGISRVGTEGKSRNVSIVTQHRANGQIKLKKNLLLKKEESANLQQWWVDLRHYREEA